MSIAKRAASRSGSPCGGSRPCTLFGLASDGVYRAGRVTPAAGALLPHRFTLATRRILAESAVRRFAFCCTFPSLTTGRRYRPSCPMKPGLSSRVAPPLVGRDASDHPTHFRTRLQHRGSGSLQQGVSEAAGSKTGRDTDHFGSSSDSETSDSKSASFSPATNAFSCSASSCLNFSTSPKPICTTSTRPSLPIRTVWGIASAK